MTETKTKISALWYFVCSPEVVHTAESELGSVNIEVHHRVHSDRHRVTGEDLQESPVRQRGVNI